MSDVLRQAREAIRDGDSIGLSALLAETPDLVERRLPPTDDVAAAQCLFSAGANLNAVNRDMLDANGRTALQIARELDEQTQGGERDYAALIAILGSE